MAGLGRAAVLAPLGLPADGLVLGQVYPRGESLAIFAATLGEALPARNRQLFDAEALADRVRALVGA